MSSQPPYIGPYTAEVYDNLFGSGALFTPAAPGEAAPIDPNINTQSDYQAQAGRAGLVKAAAIIGLIALAYFLILKLKK